MTSCSKKQYYGGIFMLLKIFHFWMRMMLSGSAPTYSSFSKLDCDTDWSGILAEILLHAGLSFQFLRQH